VKNADILTLELAIGRSCISAFEKYYKMSGGDWIYETPEYWYTSLIANGIKKALPTYNVCLEHSVASIRSSAGGRAGRPSKRMSKGQADISIWKYWSKRNEWDATSIIEVKKAWSWNKATLGADIDRLCAGLLEAGKKTVSNTKKSTGKISNTFLVVMTDEADREEKTAKKIISDRKVNLETSIQKYINNNSWPITVSSTLTLSKKYSEDDSQAAVIVFRFNIDKRKIK